MRESDSHRESILHPHNIQISEYIACLCDSQNRRRIAQSHSNTPESLFILWACISLPTSSRLILFTLQSTVPREMSVYIQAIDLNTPHVCIIRFAIGIVGLITPQSNSSTYSIWCFSAAPPAIPSFKSILWREMNRSEPLDPNCVIHSMYDSLNCRGQFTSFPLVVWVKVLTFVSTVVSD